MGMSYYRMQQLGVERMMRELANRKPTVCSECGTESFNCSTQLNPFDKKNEGLNLKARCQDCWRAFWKERDAK